MKYMTLVACVFPGKTKRYMFNASDYYAIEVGDWVVVRAKGEQQIAKVVAKARVIPGSEEADFINEYNSRRAVEPVLGKITYFDESYIGGNTY